MKRHTQQTMESKAGLASRWLQIFTTGFLGLVVAVMSTGCGGVPESEVVQREMAAAGKASYRAYCAGCHGPEGRGDGPAAEGLTPVVSDLTQISSRYGEFPEEVIFARIDGYSTQPDTTIQMMPSWGNIWRGMSMEWETPQDVRSRIDQIVSYLYSIQQTP